MLKIIPILFLVFILTSCSKKDEPTSQKPNTNKTENTTNDGEEVPMTKEEVFSSTLVQDIAGEENEALEFYLEESIYPMVSKSNKVTLDKISGSLFLLSYDENGTMKHCIIKEYYSPVKDEMVFDKVETHTDAVKQFVK